MAEYKELKEKDIYCFKAKLKRIHDDECFVVPFNVLAEDKYKAQTILEEWLSNPKQTGYKFECCVGIIPEPSNRVIVSEENVFPNDCEGCKYIGFRYPHASMYPCNNCIRANSKDYYEKGEGESEDE